MIDQRDKVRGCFLGLAIGDALGKPWESYTAEKIKKTCGRIDRYIDNPDHKYYDNKPVGSTTDDCQLSLAVARALIKGKGIDLDLIAQEHVDEYRKTTSGWGTATREAIKQISEGTHWSNVKSEDENGNKLGYGNGIAMKIAPLGLYFALQPLKMLDSDNPTCEGKIDVIGELKKIDQFVKMTHHTEVALESAFAQLFAVIKCFKSDPDNFDVNSFIKTVCWSVSNHPKKEGTLAERFKLLSEHDKYSFGKIIEDFKGNCFVYNSLPFSYMFFVKNPMTIECMYDCASSGGDVDTNASIVGALLGSLHGTKIFPNHLIDTLEDFTGIIKLADDLYDLFK